MSEEMDKLVKMLANGICPIPKSIIQNEELYDDTKIMFAIVLNESNSIQELENNIRKLPPQKIAKECDCLILKANVIKASFCLCFRI